ncbi:aromatic ring-opening dioxygenase LigA [Ornithinimicrobium kibberense]|uniref:aromatic ring-opening dioxygenase LigA n=1 Tax=Ornithinimicrobium kibberense TaxID=282060 RepID=UPI0036235EC2
MRGRQSSLPLSVTGVPGAHPIIIAGGATYVMVSQELSRANVTVAEDADFLAGEHVDGPFSAYSQAQIIDKHAPDSTGGKTYAELDREDPLRDVAMNASFLRASLFTSVVSFGVAVMAMGVGLAFILAGVGLRAVGAVAVPAARTRAEV